ncbi:MAG: ankyrin repeat domain-containing protein [Acidobacteriota bacterium]|nr:ankyrin repeat domain-containing protein [Acidobacteriota bacterium]
MADSERELFEAVKAGRRPDVEALLDRDPKLLPARVPDGPSAILLAAYYRHPDVADAFIARGAPLDIFEASAFGKIDRLRDLLNEDPSRANAWSPDGFFPLGLAAFFGHPEAVRVLLEAGADVGATARNAMRVQALHAAAASHNPESIRLLLEAGADANAVQQAGYVALHEAAGNGDTAMTELLVAHGARTDARAEDGRTAAEMARAKGHEDLARWLESRGEA